MKNKLQAYGGKIIIKKTDAKVKTTGGLDIPDDAKKTSNSGIVITVSHFVHDAITGKYNDTYNGIPCYNIEVGDLIYFDKYSGNMIEHNDEEYLALDRKDILAFVKA